MQKRNQYPANFASKHVLSLLGAFVGAFASPFGAACCSGAWVLATAFLVAWIACLGDCADAAPVVVGTFDQEVALHGERQTGLPSQNVLNVLADNGRIVAETDRGSAVWDGRKWQVCEPVSVTAPPSLPSNLETTQITPSRDTTKWAVASAQGLFEQSTASDWQKIRVTDGLGRLWADHDVRGATYDANNRLWFATLAGVGVRRPDGKWQMFQGQDGLPYNDFTCMSSAPHGDVWFGTRRGAIRYDGQRWAYRQGLRWLPNDDVRGMVIDEDGTVWLATASGVGCIARQATSLESKARFYETEIDRFLKRTKYGYLSTSRLAAPADKASATPIASDNDGLWTAMYGASQCYAYAVNRTARSKQQATSAFEALRFLQVVTQGSEHSPPNGYVARTVLPTTEADPNAGRIESDQAFQKTRDRMWKVYQPRWPQSADGQWYWKSDTSSDELDGHFFLYALYFDLVAESDGEKARVRTVVRNLIDHLISHDFVLQDHDGKPTRWANYRPSSLNHDIRWIDERGLNSLSMLSYLAVAHHVTGDSRYEAVARELRDTHGFAANLMTPKAQRGIGSGNQSDDEMAFMNFYNLVRYTSDPALRERYLSAFFSYWLLVQPERNPFFHFAYASVGNGITVADTFGDRPLSPHGDWLEDSVDALKRFPFDRLNWAHSNSHRLDIVPLPAQQGRDLFAVRRESTRGYRIDGKVLPVDERFFHHWNTDSWQLDYGGDGRSLASGTVFLLPYYMGQYHRFIE